MPKGVPDDKLSRIVLMSFAAAGHFELSELKHVTTLTKKPFAEALNKYNDEQKIIANYFNDIPSSAVKEALELIEKFQDIFNLDNDNEYDELYKIINKGKAKYAKEYNENGYEEVAESIKKDFIAAQKKPLKKAGAVKRNAAQASGSDNEQDLRLQIANLEGQVGKQFLNLLFMYCFYKLLLFAAAHEFSFKTLATALGDSLKKIAARLERKEEERDVPEGNDEEDEEEEDEEEEEEDDKHEKNKKTKKSHSPEPEQSAKK
jgi:hypothetical protein